MLEPIAARQKPKLLHVPYVAFATPCDDMGPHYECNRPEGHTGRHCYSWRNARGPMQGQVREVWS